MATTQSAIIASEGGGGTTHTRSIKLIPCATVEVYNSKTSQWYTADPLPAPCGAMTSIIIADTCYLVGGCDDDAKAIAAILYASLTFLVQKATSPTLQSASHTTVWKTLPGTSCIGSAPVSLSGHLVTAGGFKGKTSTAALGVCILATKIGIALPADPEVHAFFPDTNSWVRLTTEDLPERLADCTAVHLSYNTTMVISGGDNHANIPRLFSRRLSQFTTELVSPLCSCFCMLFQV